MREWGRNKERKSNIKVGQPYLERKNITCSAPTAGVATDGAHDGKANRDTRE